jgi:hypothetical protein
MDRPRPSPPIQIPTNENTQNRLLGGAHPQKLTLEGWFGLVCFGFVWLGLGFGLAWFGPRRRRRGPPRLVVVVVVVVVRRRQRLQWQSDPRGGEGGADIAAWGYWDTPIHGEASPWMEVPQSIMRPQTPMRLKWCFLFIHQFASEVSTHYTHIQTFKN